MTDPAPNGINDPNVQAWLAHNLVSVDENGIPHAGQPVPPQPCNLCGTISEYPVIGYLWAKSREYRLITCNACYKLQFTDRNSYWVLVNASLSQGETAK